MRPGIKAKRIIRILCTVVVFAAIVFLCLGNFGLTGNKQEEIAVETIYSVENLDRGIYAFGTEEGVYVSWRICTDDKKKTVFRLYRDGKKIHECSLWEPSCYLDKQGSVSSTYILEAFCDDTVIENTSFVPADREGYFDIEINKPDEGYMPGDCSVGDTDGDGCYELFLKWEAQTKDPAQKGVTDPTYIDCIKVDGTRLWRINLGNNIRSGQHYTPMSVADFDCDGCAEIIMRTADGTTDGMGNIIGDALLNYVDDMGRILEGDEYLTLFDGKTGEAIDTIDFPVARGESILWGDEKGYRCDRFNAGAAYFDGVHPSAVFERGYYTRLTVSAIDVIDRKLRVRWIFDTGSDETNPAYGGGNHNLMPADVDQDGKQEICLGSACIDDNGTLLWCTGTGHGDAMHVGCFKAGSNSILVYTCLEYEPYGVILIDGKTGNTVFQLEGTKDTGRCLADDLLSGKRGTEFLLSGQYGMYDGSGKLIDENKKADKNFLVYWDGDVQREILNDICISKMNSSDSVDVIFTANGCVSVNDTKANPCLCADLVGDWREEVIFPVADGSALRVWCTTITTELSMVTLMQDPQYRMQVSCQQSGYNQPPHTGFNLSYKKCRERRASGQVIQ